MKIVCDNCGKKYSVDDDKVRGKMFKIRCRSCDNVIVIKGNVENQPQPGYQEEGGLPTRVVNYGGIGEELPIWYVIINGEQQGPFTQSKIIDMRKDNSINDESYCWRDGLEDWQPLSNIEELMQVIAFGSDSNEEDGTQVSPQYNADQNEENYDATVKHSDNPVTYKPSPILNQPSPVVNQPVAKVQPQPQVQAFSQVQSQPVDESKGAPFSAAFSPTENKQTAAKRNTELGRDLFDGSENEEGALFSPNPNDVISSSPVPKVEVSNMPGVRHDNSVLFSLNNLQALANSRRKVSPQTTTSSSSTSSSPQTSQQLPTKSSEASGLIDIKSLAAEVEVSSASGGLDDILALGGGGFSPALGAPVLLPQKQETSKLVYIGIGFGGLILIGLIVLVVILLLRKPQIQQIQVPQQNQQVDNTKEIKVAQNQQENQDLNNPDRFKQLRVENEENTGEENTGDNKTKRVKGKIGPRVGNQAKNNETNNEEEQQDEGIPLSKKTSGNSKLDQLLGDALGLGGGTQQKKVKNVVSKNQGNTGGGSDMLPDIPTKGQIQSGMKAVEPRILNCGRGQSGLVQVKVKIMGSTGRVGSANVEGQFAGTPVGSCVAREIRNASFPRFKRDSLTVLYPFRLR